MMATRFTSFALFVVLLVASMVAVPAGAQIYFSDDFEDPAASEGNWEVVTGQWQVVDGVYHQSSTADPWLVSMVAADRWNDDWVEYTIEFDVRPLTEGDAPVNVLFRVQDPVPQIWSDRNGPNTHMYRWIVNGWTNSESRPYIYNEGTSTMLAQTNNSLEVGSWHHIMLVVTQTGMAGYVDDVEMFDVQHAEWTQGRVGIHAYSGMMDFDNLIVYGPEYMPIWRLKAKRPEPADGEVGVQVPLLQWTPGETAVLHELYLGLTPELTEDNLVGPRSPMTLYFHGPGLEPGGTYYWRVDEIEADGTTVHTGDVWSFVAQDVTAYHPSPADGAGDVALLPELAWMPGQSVLEHRIYFSADRADVNDRAAAADQGQTEETTFQTEALDAATDYYWCVDEAAATGELLPGPVWSFATRLPVDDFEGYTNEVGERVFEVWVDGIGFSLPEPGNPGNGSNAAVGHDIWDPAGPHYNASIMETVIVRGGAQSMPLSYSNAEAPYYSEAVREFSGPQDWTVNGLNTLTLFVRGRSANEAAPLYVTVEDSAGRAATVTDPNPDAARRYTWIEWKIPLSDLGDVDATRVRKLIVGLGDRANPAPGGVGTIYVDDVYVAREADAAQ
jgi:hypothetical protein